MDVNFLEALKKIEEIHRTKNADYATTNDPLKNFKDSAEFAAKFPKEYVAFTVLIGTKLSRLSNLLTESKKPNHESIEDTFIDVAVYFLLWRSFYIEFSMEQVLKMATFLPDKPTTLGVITDIIEPSGDDF